MAKFSIGDAATAGFGLIARKPMAVLGWGLAYMVVATLPTMLLFYLTGAGPDLVETYRVMLSSPQEAQFAAHSFHNKLGAWNPIITLVSLFGEMVVATAVYRAVIHPEQGAFGYLRVGKTELWMTLLFIVMVVLAVVGLIGGEILGGVGGFALFFLGKSLAQPWGGLVQGVGIALWVCFVLGLFFWVCLRLSMAGPMTAADGTFRLFESWKVTKGQSGRLFLMGLLLIVIVLLLELVVMGVIGASAIIAVTHSGLNDDTFRSWAAQPSEALWRTLAPALAVMMIVGSLLTGVFYAVMFAPWAYVYRHLAASDAA